MARRAVGTASLNTKTKPRLLFGRGVVGVTIHPLRHDNTNHKCPLNGLKSGGNEMSDWITEVAKAMSIERLPDELQTLAQNIGMETTLRVIEILGGINIYFPKLGSLVRPIRDNNIRKEFTGANHRSLAKKYNLTESWVRNIVKKRPKPQKG